MVFTNKTATWVYVVASILVGAELAYTFGLLWLGASVPAFFCFKGLDSFGRALPPRARVFAPLIAVLTLMLVATLVMVALSPYETSDKAPSAAVTPAVDGLAAPETIASIQPEDKHAIAVQMTSALTAPAESEAAVRLFSLFVSELNQRSTTLDFDKQSWVKAMQYCLKLQGDVAVVDAAKMSLMAECADARLDSEATPKQ